MKTSAFVRTVPSKSERAQRRLLEASLEVFGEKGLHGATVRDIARAAGQNIAAIAYYYGSKEKLYRAALEAIVREIRHHLADVLGDIGQFQSQPTQEPGKALRLLQNFLCAVYERLLSRTAVVALARIIVREQMQPTPAFEILYQQGFRDFHEKLCQLVGACLGQDPADRKTILRTHTLMGQVYFFAMSRETILRRLRWKDLEGERASMVTAVLKENLEVLLHGLRHENPSELLESKVGKN